MCRALRTFIPTGQRWTDAEVAGFRPMAPEVIASLTNELTMQGVANNPAWLDELIILVTSNADKAILTACAAKLFAIRHNRILLRWRRQLRQELPPGLQRLVYDEDTNPELIAYFVAGAPANVLDNNSGNDGCGVANGSSCRFHSLAWDDESKCHVVRELVKEVRRTGNTIVDLPFPPEFINVQLLDSNQVLLSASQWPPDNNLEREWLYDLNGERSCKASVIHRPR